MNRREFLATLGIGAPAAVVAAKAGLFERVRSYFFAPKGGWQIRDGIYVSDWFYDSPRGGVIITNMRPPEPFEVDPSTGLLSMGGQCVFPQYGTDGGLQKDFLAYYLTFQGIEAHPVDPSHHPSAWDASRSVS